MIVLTNEELVDFQMNDKNSKNYLDGLNPTDFKELKFIFQGYVSGVMGRIHLT